MSVYKSFVADLFVFFDKESQDNFSLKKLTNLIKDYMELEQFEQMAMEIEGIKTSHGITIGLIHDLRNADVAHQSLSPRSQHILYEKVEGSFSGVQEILNLMSKHVSDSFTVWDHIPRDVEHDMEWVIDNLERGEKARLDELQQGLDKKVMSG